MAKLSLIIYITCVYINSGRFAGAACASLWRYEQGDLNNQLQAFSQSFHDILFIIQHTLFNRAVNV